jgi:hypothetical protein
MHKSVVENIQLMPTLLSRFDLIYLVLDQVSYSLPVHSRVPFLSFVSFLFLFLL